MSTKICCVVVSFMKTDSVKSRILLECVNKFLHALSRYFGEALCRGSAPKVNWYFLISVKVGTEKAGRSFVMGVNRDT